MKTRIWYTADGRNIQIRQMETRHIMSAVKRIFRSGGWRRHYLPRLIGELKSRAGHA